MAGDRIRYPEKLSNLHSLYEQLKGQLANGKAIADRFTNLSVGLAIVSYPDFVFQVANLAYQALTPHPEIVPKAEGSRKSGHPQRGMLDQAVCAG